MSSAIANLWSAVSTTCGQVAEATGAAAAELVNETAADVEEIGRAAKKDGLAAAFVKTVDAVSLGNGVANAADALGIIPEGDELTKNLLSGAVNFVAGGALSPYVWVDAIDVARELGTSNVKPGVTMPKSQEPSRPDDGKRRGAGGYCGNGAPRGVGSVLCGMDGLIKNVGDQVGQLVGRGGCSSSTDPVCHHAPPGTRIPLPPEVANAIRNRIDRPNGGPVLGRPISEVSYDDIFNDKSLSFEDLLFLVMMKVGSDMQKEMEKQLKELADVNKQLDGGSTSKAGGNEKGGTKGQTAGSDASAPAAGGFNLDPGSLVKGFLSPENLKGLASGALDLASALAPIVVPAALTAIGTAFPIVGNIVGAVGGEAIGVLTAGGCQLLKGCVQSGAFDGVFDGANQLAGGAPATAQATGSASSASAPSTPGGKLSEDDKGALKNRREELFEKIKLANAKLSEMQQTLSNILNSQHETAMAAIRNIR